MEFESILVRAANWVGDAVMSVPALQALRREHPGAHIAILARPWVAGLYGREPFCDELIPYNAPKGWSGLDQKLRIASGLKKHRFHCAILLQNAFEAAAIAWAARIPVRIGYNRDRRGVLLTQPIAPPAAGSIHPHHRFYYSELLKRAGVISDYSTSEPIRLQGAAQAAQEGRTRLQQAGLRLPAVALAPGAAYGGAKRWLPERFAAAAVQVAQVSEASVAVFGSAGEADICQAVAKQVQAAGLRVCDFSGQTSLPQLIECLAACQILITNDSGPMHIASALGVPTVAVFGATDHIATGPTGDSARVVRVPVECSPCLLRECPIDHRCMTRVSSDLVAGEALRLSAKPTPVLRAAKMK